MKLHCVIPSPSQHYKSSENKKEIPERTQYRNPVDIRDKENVSVVMTTLNIML